MHFWGIAFVDDESCDLCDIMDRFDENRAAEFHSAFEFYDEWQNDGDEYLVTPAGVLKHLWDEGYHYTYRHVDGRVERVAPKLPDGWKLEYRPYRDFYANFEQFAEQEHGCIDDPDNGWGYWDNPDGHLDYWRIGGRWAGGLQAVKGDRVAPSWELADWLKNHPDEEWYGDTDFDIAEVDDLIEDRQKAPYFAVLPDGTWVDKCEWGEDDTGFFDGEKDESAARMFWEKIVAPLRGTGAIAYTIDIHD